MKFGKFIIAPLLTFGFIILSSGEFLAESYLYDQNNEAVESPDAYVVSKEISIEADGIKAVSPQDIFYSESGKLYVVDTNNHRILIYDEEYKLLDVLSVFTQEGGSQTSLSKPEGIYVDEEDTIYIADTGNHRIIKCDIQGNVLLQIDKPENLIGVSEDSAFNPIKLSVDKSGRIYVVARNYNMGILQLDPNGKFVGYVGAPKVQYNIIQMLWRKISTEEQLAKMEQYVPTEYNNISIDQEGFIYGTIGTLNAEELEKAISSNDLSGTITPIKKLNTVGNDVLKRNGFFAPVGDLEYDEVYSKIVDVAYTTGDRYALLDTTHGHIFVYDSNGNMLCAFGNENFVQLSSLTYVNEQLIVLDAQGAKLYIYKPTTYGTMLFDAVLAQYNGDFDVAYELWSDVATYNYNFDYAFVGLGQSYMNSDDYEQAMECFQRVGDKSNYSKAKELMRKESMKTVFPVIFISIICIGVFAIIFNYAKKIHLYIKGENGGNP